eukprot:583203-Rhodomonas_salina.1
MAPSRQLSTVQAAPVAGALSGISQVLRTCCECQVWLGCVPASLSGRKNETFLDRVDARPPHQHSHNVVIRSCVLAEQPFDTIKIRMQSTVDCRFNAMGTPTMILKRTVVDEGWGALMQGLAPRIAFYGVVKLSLFSLYERLHQRLNHPTLAGAIAGGLNTVGADTPPASPEWISSFFPLHTPSSAEIVLLQGFLYGSTHGAAYVGWRRESWLPTQDRHLKQLVSGPDGRGWRHHGSVEGLHGWGPGDTWVVQRMGSAGSTRHDRVACPSWCSAATVRCPIPAS